jgi:hypothetical protein
LVYPLCIFFVFHKENLKTDILKMIMYSMEWCIGYVCMWASKWILTDIMLESNIIQDALSTVLLRTQSVEDVTRVEGLINVISLHIQPFANWCYIILILILLVFVAIKVFRAGIRRVCTQMTKGCVYFIIALYPFAWLFVVQNHSVQHWQFTCRILSATVFAGVVAVCTLIEECTKKGT